MSEASSSRDLDISEDYSFEQRVWKIQRIGWVIMVVAIVFGLLGLLGGPGPLSIATIGSDASPLQVQFLRFLHELQPTNLVITVNPPDNAESIELFIDLDYLEHMEIMTIVPEPDTVTAASDRIIYEFPLQTPGESTTITFRLNPERFGFFNARVGLQGGLEYGFTQLIYP